MTRHALRFILLACSSILIGGCAAAVGHQHRHLEATLPPEPDVVAYCHEAFLERIDLGDPGQSHGDMVTWSADVLDAIPASRDRADGTATGIASGYMIVTRPNDEVGSRVGDDREFRLSTMTMSWDGTDDSVIFSGLHAYGHDAPRLDNSVTRPIIGGTGRFLSRPGLAIVTPEGDAWFRVEIYLARQGTASNFTAGDKNRD
jgi:hypothetical protein